MTTSKLQRRCRLTYVPRWTIVPMLRQQSVAEHTFRVMAILQELVVHANLLEAMDHDLEEAFTGDTPSPAKNISERAASLLLLADKIEAYTWLKTWGVKNNRSHNILVGLMDQISTMAWELKVESTTFDIINQLEEE